jgi:hypothetical protein
MCIKHIQHDLQQALFTSLGSHPSGLNHPDEVFYGPVVTPLIIIEKETARKFAMPPVIMEAFATLPLSGTGLVGAVAVFNVPVFCTFHNPFSRSVF